MGPSKTGGAQGQAQSAARQDGAAKPDTGKPKADGRYRTKFSFAGDKANVTGKQETIEQPLNRLAGVSTGLP